MNAEFEDLLFSLPFPAVITDSEGKIERVNQKFESLSNRSFKFLKGKPISEVLKVEELPSLIKKAFNETIEIRGFRKGEFIFHVSPLFTPSKKVGVVVLIEPCSISPFEEDITLFLKGLSHEIKNPLSGIKGAAKLFKELKSYDEELAQVIVSEVERIERLLKDITRSFDFSRLSFREENIHRIIQQVFNLFGAKIKEKGIKVRFLFDPSLPEVPVDVDKMTQAVLNVVKNAIEAVEESEKREITVETGYAIRPSGFIFIKVTDTGRGMEEEELRKFGLPFFTTKERGSGLGTFIVKEVIKGHGGEVKVESSPGKGTSVKLLIPMKR